MKRALSSAGADNRDKRSQSLSKSIGKTNTKNCLKLSDVFKTIQCKNFQTKDICRDSIKLEVDVKVEQEPEKELEQNHESQECLEQKLKTQDKNFQTEEGVDSDTTRLVKTETKTGRIKNIKMGRVSKELAKLNQKMNQKSSYYKDQKVVTEPKEYYQQKYVMPVTQKSCNIRKFILQKKSSYNKPCTEDSNKSSSVCIKNSFRNKSAEENITSPKPYQPIASNTNSIKIKNALKYTINYQQNQKLEQQHYTNIQTQKSSLNKTCGITYLDSSPTQKIPRSNSKEINAYIDIYSKKFCLSNDGSQNIGGYSDRQLASTISYENIKTQQTSNKAAPHFFKFKKGGNLKTEFGDQSGSFCDQTKETNRLSTSKGSLQFPGYKQAKNISHPYKQSFRTSYDDSSYIGGECPKNEKDKIDKFLNQEYQKLDIYKESYNTSFVKNQKDFYSNYNKLDACLKAVIPKSLKMNKSTKVKNENIMNQDIFKPVSSRECLSEGRAYVLKARPQTAFAKESFMAERNKAALTCRNLLYYKRPVSRCKEIDKELKGKIFSKGSMVKGKFCNDFFESWGINVSVPFTDSFREAG